MTLRKKGSRGVSNLQNSGGHRRFPNWKKSGISQYRQDRMLSTAVNLQLSEFLASSSEIIFYTYYQPKRKSLLRETLIVYFGNLKQKCDFHCCLACYSVLRFDSLIHFWKETTVKIGTTVNVGGVITTARKCETLFLKPRINYC